MNDVICTTDHPFSSRHKAHTAQKEKPVFAGGDRAQTYCSRILSAKNRDHALTGNWQGYRECHIAPDWMLIYKIAGKDVILVRTGSHSDLFG